MADFGPLVSTDWLAVHLGEKDLKIIDGSWRMPGEAPAREDYERRHIPGAVFFDIDEVSDRTSPLPHMLPAPEDFGKAVGALGIADKDIIVVYDDNGLFSAPRVWWSFHAMGHKKIAVMDGGLPKWRAEGRPLAAGADKPAPATFKARLQKQWISTADDVRTALRSSRAMIADARPAPRFCGEAPEPRPGLRSGHMPGAVNVPYGMLTGPNQTLLAPTAIKAVFERAGLDLKRPIVATCGSGITAAVLCLALERVGHKRHGLYDGSWAEWGNMRNAEQEYPVAAGQ
jgi:thiosulfate/3-mercaptopyruvate sulfurtransferase